MSQEEQELVLVTGANGYVASFVVKELLEHGYKVRGTVRSLKDKAKYSHLLTLPHAQENLELVEADLVKDGSFDDAVVGCDFVMHTASPFFLPSPDVDPQKALIEPALNGTRNVLNSIEKQRNKIKRVVITSSTAAVLSTPHRVHGKVYSEADWNEVSSLTIGPYAYSKVLAEREAWKLWNEMKEKYSDEQIFDLSVVNPTLVVGPILQTDRLNENGAEELNTSCQLVRKVLLQRKLNPENGNVLSAAEGWTFVDVRDVGKIHRLVMETPAAGGSRFVSVAGKDTWARLIQKILVKFPELNDTVPTQIEGDLEDGYDKLANFSTEHLKKTIPQFGEFISVEQSIFDTVQALKDHNLLV